MKLIQPENDAAVFLVAGIDATWASDGSVVAALTAAGLVSPGIVSVQRKALDALILNGPVPVYGATPPNQPARTTAADFATHRP